MISEKVLIKAYEIYINDIGNRLWYYKYTSFKEYCVTKSIVHDGDIEISFYHEYYLPTLKELRKKKINILNDD